MKQKIREWWTDLTLRALARRHGIEANPERDDVVFAILLRREIEARQKQKKEGA